MAEEARITESTKSEEGQQADKNPDAAVPDEDRWYHGPINRAQAEERLRAVGTVGCYLIRESVRAASRSSTMNNDSVCREKFVISFLGHDDVKHYAVDVKLGKCYIGVQQFDSLKSIVGYYSFLGHLEESQHLVTPVPPPYTLDVRRKQVGAIIDHNAAEGSKELSFKAGDQLSVISTVDDSWYWARLETTQQTGLVLISLTDRMDPLRGKDYYYSNYDKALLKSLLLRAGRIGSYLVRPSEHSQGLTLVVKVAGNRTMNYEIVERYGSYHVGWREFACLDDLIKWYQDQDIEEGVKLSSPFIAQDILDTSNLSVTSADSISAGGIFAANISSFKSGYLNRKGNKKWRRLYFVLETSKQCLMYFEDERSLKMKGTIDLGQAIVIGTDDSLHGRRFCFQVHEKTGDSYTVLEVSADNNMTLQSWMDTISKYSGGMFILYSSLDTGMITPVRVFQTLSVMISDARNLSAAPKTASVYVVVLIDDIKVGRTRPIDVSMGSVEWNEKMKLTYLPVNFQQVVFILYYQQRHFKDPEICRAIVPFSLIHAQKSLDDRLGLFAYGQSSKVEPGSLRACLIYQHELILPMEEYTQLLEGIISKDIEILEFLGESCSSERTSLATVLLQIFRARGLEAELIKNLACKEIQCEEEPMTLFRHNSLATALMDCYMKTVGIGYLELCVKSTINQVLDQKHAIEVDPNKAKKGVNFTQNLRQLLEYLNDMINVIFSSYEKCPKSLRYIFYNMQCTVTKKWPDDNTLRTKVISAFLFLRFFGVVLVNPKAYGLLTEAPTGPAMRTLTLLAKTLQNLSNLVDFGKKEEYMEMLNTFIQSNKDRMVIYIDNISRVPSLMQPDDDPTADISRHLAQLQSLCYSCRDSFIQAGDARPKIAAFWSVVEQIQRKKDLLTKTNPDLVSPRSNGST